MDNYNSNSSGVNDSIFNFIPPNMMYPQEHNVSNESDEERERQKYHENTDNDFHIKDEPPYDKTL